MGRLDELRRAWRLAWAKPLQTTVVVLVLLSVMFSAFSSLISYDAQDSAHEAVDAVERNAAIDLHRACEALNQNREDARQLMRRGDIESGEALIETVSAGDGVSPETLDAIERFRENLSRRQQNIIDEHSNDDVNCDEVAPLPE